MEAKIDSKNKGDLVTSQVIESGISEVVEINKGFEVLNIA